MSAPKVRLGDIVLYHGLSDQVVGNNPDGATQRDYAAVVTGVAHEGAVELFVLRGAYQSSGYTTAKYSLSPELHTWRERTVSVAVVETEDVSAGD